MDDEMELDFSFDNDASASSFGWNFQVNAGIFLFLHYIKEAKATRTGGVGTEVTLEFNGDIWNNSFGAVQNDIISCKYKYKKSNENTWSESNQNLTPVKSGNSYSLATTIKGDLGAEGFTRDDSFDIEIVITDKLSTYTYPLTLGSGKPGIAVHKNGVGFGAPYDTEEGGSCQVDGKNIVKKIEGTEWTDLELNTDWRNLGGNYYNAQYKKVNNQIYLRGLIKNSNNNTNKTVLTLPEGIRPQKIPYLMFNMSDTFVSAYITAGGEIRLAQYTQNNWVSIEANFFVD